MNTCPPWMRFVVSWALDALGDELLDRVRLAEGSIFERAHAVDPVAAGLGWTSESPCRAARLLPRADQ